LYTLFAQQKYQSVSESWKKEIIDIINTSDDSHLEKIGTIPSPYFEWFTQGQLNASTFWHSIYNPLHFVKIMDETNRSTVSAKNLLTRYVTDMVDIVHKNNAQIITIDIPYPIYVSNKYISSQNELGFHYPITLPETDIPLNVFSTASTLALVDKSIPLLTQFRTNCSDCFYPYDAHLNAKGQKFLGELIGKNIETIIQSLSVVRTQF
jgi:hypothetical protein